MKSSKSTSNSVQFEPATNADSLVRIARFCALYPDWTELAVRDLVFYSKSNGLDAFGAVVKCDRRVFIDVHKFFDWVRAGGRTGYLSRQSAQKSSTARAKCG